MISDSWIYNIAVNHKKKDKQFQIILEKYISYF